MFTVHSKDFMSSFKPTLISCINNVQMYIVFLYARVYTCVKLLDVTVK